jgi:hypothetical protein
VLQLRFILISIGAAIGLFLCLLLFVEMGRRLGERRMKRVGRPPSSGGIADNSVYGLLALLIGFTFSGAAARFDHRRELVGDEANAASTTWQRIELLPAALQEPIRGGLRHYLDAVIAWYGTDSFDVALIQPASVTRAQQDVWRRSVEACLTPEGEGARILLPPAFNELFDAVDRERMARRLHPPTIVWLMLGLTAMASALFLGFESAGAPRNWLYTLGFTATVAMSTYVIIELEYPRLGLATSAALIDQPLIDVRASLD